LHHAFVEPPGGRPRAWMPVLHGIYGQGGNWRTFARRLVERRPEWGCVLVDVREHGRSQGLSPPHTLGAAAADVAGLIAELDAGGRPVGALAGHSFGGKVTLAALERVGVALERAWIFDASPSARPGALDEPGNSVAAVLRALAALPPRMTGRDDFAARLAAAALDPAVTSWLGLNLEPADGGWRFRLDPGALRELLADHYATDVWYVVESPPCPLRFAVAARGSALSADDQLRLRRLAGPRLAVHELDSGHWLHVDALDALVDLVAADLP
jgi:pimeloyl-ACP methyl ester carboxylesterase